VGGAQVGAEDDPAVAVERQAGGRATAGRGAVAAFDEEAGEEKLVDPLGHRRPGQAGGPRQAGPRVGVPVPDELEQRTGRHRMGRGRPAGGGMAMWCRPGRHATVVTRQALFGQRRKMKIFACHPT